MSLRKKRLENKAYLEASLSLKKFMVVFYVCSARSGFTGTYLTHFDTPVVEGPGDLYIIYFWVRETIIFTEKAFLTQCTKMSVH